MAWLNLIGNLATLVTAFGTFITVIWLYIDRRAQIEATIEVYDLKYYLKIENVGKSVAKDIRVTVKEAFIDSLPQCGSNREDLRQLKNYTLYLQPGAFKYFLLLDCEHIQDPNDRQKLCNAWLKEHVNTPIEIKITYHCMRKTIITFCIGNFSMRSAKIKSPLERLVEEVHILNEQIKEQHNG
jgi:hypothetical protein